MAPHKNEKRGYIYPRGIRPLNYSRFTAREMQDSGTAGKYLLHKNIVHCRTRTIYTIAFYETSLPTPTPNPSPLLPPHTDQSREVANKQRGTSLSSTSDQDIICSIVSIIDVAAQRVRERRVALVKTKVGAKETLYQIVPLSMIRTSLLTKNVEHCSIHGSW